MCLDSPDEACDQDSDRLTIEIEACYLVFSKHNESLPVDSYHVLWGELCLVGVAIRIRAFEDARLSDSVVTVLAECVPTFGEAVHAAFFAVFAY